MVVDVHAHTIPSELVARLAADGAQWGVAVEQAGGSVYFAHREGYRYPVGPEFTSVETLLQRMAGAGVAHRILCLPPTLFFYAQPSAAARAFCRIANDAMLAMVATAPAGRLSAMITVPLQDPEAAAEEVARLAGSRAGPQGSPAARPTLKGVEIGTNVEATPLDDPALEPFFTACEQARLPIFLHPYYVGPKPRLEPYYLTNSLGNPLDTTIAAARLIHGGVLQRHPGLRVVLAHGGGFFPYQLGRLQHSFRVRPEPRARCQEPPESFLAQLYCDTVLHFPPALRYLVDVMGADHVLLGTDDPFDMGDAVPLHHVEAAGLSPDQKEQVLGAAAARLFGLAEAAVPHDRQEVEIP